MIILDQFEELIRHQPKLYDDVRRWVEHVVDRYRVHIVISLRTEFEHRMRDLKVGPYKRDEFYLNPISDAAVVSEIVRRGRRPDADSEPVISADAVERIVELWTEAEGGNAWSGVGLLHLQSLLYVLWRHHEGTMVTRDTVSAVESELASGDAAALFADSLAAAVSLRLAECEAIYLRESGGDTTMADGVIGQIARMSLHLSSGGYKVDQDRLDLAALVLQTEFTALNVDRTLDPSSDVGRIYESFASKVDLGLEWLSAPRAELVPADLAVALADRVEGAEVASAGPMLGLPARAVALEELRRYFFALAWLQESDLVRVTSAHAGDTRLALVHDGFGRGLRKWAETKADSPARAMSRITAAIGEVFAWAGSAPSQHDILDGTSEIDGYRVLPNLRWRSCRVSDVTLRSLVFVNCDFRETTFLECRFEGVTFVNCLLDGVAFTACTVVGEPTAPPRKTSTEDRMLPSFIIDSSEQAAAANSGTVPLVTLLNRYRETSVATDRLGSWTSGWAATPISDGLVAELQTAQQNRFEFETYSPQTGGLVMYGGRLSSLTFGECTFLDGGVVSLRHVAGTSLEFTGQGSGHLELCDVAIRGLSVSPSVGTEASDDEQPFFVDAYDSTLQNVWFSTPLRGRATFENSVIWQIFSASAQKDFAVTLSGSPFVGAINVAQFDAPLEASPQTFVAVEKALDGVADTARKVDFQSLDVLRERSGQPPEE